MEMDVNGTIGQAVAEYVGPGATVVELDVVLDPEVVGTYAIQAVVKPEVGNAFAVQFLMDVPVASVTARDLNEVEFTSWPPRPRS